MTIDKVIIISEGTVIPDDRAEDIRSFGGRIVYCPGAETTVERVGNSDYERIRLAAENPNLYYSDWDIRWVEEQYDFPERGKPYFIREGINPCISEAAFFVNGCCDFFKAILDKYDRTKTLWLGQYITNLKDCTYRIPERFYEHKHATGHSNVYRDYYKTLTV